MENIEKAKNYLLKYSSDYVYKKDTITAIWHDTHPVISNVRRGAQQKNPVFGITKKALHSTSDVANGVISTIYSPFITPILTNTFNTIETKIKNIYLKNNYKYAEDEELKFEIKMFSMPNLDSHRQKIDVAYQAYNNYVNNTSNYYFNAAKNGNLCDYHFNYNILSTQLKKRLNIMNKSCNLILDLISHIKEETDRMIKTLTLQEKNYWSDFTHTSLLNVNEYHTKCKKCLKNKEEYVIINNEFYNSIRSVGTACGDFMMNIGTSYFNNNLKSQTAKIVTSTRL